MTDVCFRLTQSGIESIYPFMTKRKYEIDFEELIWLGNHGNSKMDDVPKDLKNVQKMLGEIEYGFFGLRCEVKKGIFEYLVGQKMKSSLVILADKDHCEGLKIKYEHKLYLDNVLK